MELKTPGKTKTKRTARTAVDAAVAAGNEASKKLGQQQAADKKPAAPKQSGRGRKADQQQADAGTGAGKQGATSSGKEETGQAGASSASTEVLRGGTKQVLIENVPMPPRPGRPKKEEEYPFGVLSPAVKHGKEITGPSFFIPDTDNPEKHITAARKRHGCLFWARKTTGQVNGKGPIVPGRRIWRGSDEFTA